MPIHRCRICAQPLPAAHLLHFENMPKAAQFLPDAKDLVQDRGVDLDVYQCAACGLVQTSNEPVAYYKEVVRAAAFSQEMQAYRREQFDVFVQQYNLQGKKLLEIGCGRGEYLSLFKEAGVAAHGIEEAAASVQHCAEQGLNVTRGYIDRTDYALPDAPYDAFAVLNFMEHWPDPNASLKGMAHNLREGGIGLVEVPNFDMILRKNLFTEFISDHIFYFTRETLETTLRLNGFEVLTCDEIWYGYILSAVVRKRGTVDVSSFATRKQQIKDSIDAFVEKHKGQGVAIWGAGHQALASIALLGLAEEIKYVVDSAPFKQNKFTPASHIPIVAPEHLDADPVGALIIMAASYSDEVAKLVRARFGDRMAVAILRDDKLEAY